MRKPSNYDAIVIGAGMAGVCFALAMAKAGKKVLVVNRQGIAGQSSPAAGGILDPLLEMKPGSPLFRLSEKASQSYPSFIREVQREVKFDVGYKRTGMLYVALTSAEESVLKKRYAWQKKTKIEVEWLRQSQILKKYPYLSPNSAGGIFYPTIARVHPDKLLKALKVYAKKHGVRFLTVKNDVLLALAQKKISGVYCDRKLFSAPIVVNASGAWAARLKMAGIKIPVSPVRGQIAIYRAKKWRCATILHTVNGGYLVPWEGEDYLAGSTVEHVGFNPVVTRKGKELICSKVSALCPVVKSFKLKKAWAGLRPFSKDGLPWIGETKIKGLYLAAGYYRSGILISPLVGEFLAEQIITGKSSPELKPFTPKRRLK